MKLSISRTRHPYCRCARAVHGGRKVLFCSRCITSRRSERGGIYGGGAGEKEQPLSRWPVYNIVADTYIDVDEVFSLKRPISETNATARPVSGFQLFRFFNA